MSTWYGWNLNSWATQQFTKRYYKHQGIRFTKSGTVFGKPSKRRFIHPRVKIAWGGIWKPLTVPQVKSGTGTRFILNGKNRYEWRHR